MKIAPSPIRSSVESQKAPNLLDPPGGPGHVAVEEVAEHERGDHQDAGQQHALGEEDERARRHPEGADQGHGVRAHAHPDEQVGNGRDDLREEGAETFHHVGSRLPVRVGQTACGTACGWSSTGANASSAAPISGESSSSRAERMATSPRGETRALRSSDSHDPSLRGPPDLGQAAAEDDDLGVEEVDDRSEADTAPFGDLVDGACSTRLARRGRRRSPRRRPAGRRRAAGRPAGAGRSPPPSSPSSRSRRTGRPGRGCRPACDRPRRRTRWHR